MKRDGVLPPSDFNIQICSSWEVKLFKALGRHHNFDVPQFLELVNLRYPIFALHANVTAPYYM
jgi:hypothetical protein